LVPATNERSLQNEKYQTMGFAYSLCVNDDTYIPQSPSFFPVLSVRKRRSSVTTVNSIEVWENEMKERSIPKRFGPPTIHRDDGYDLGLRFKM
jgi:predicted component of viral defense system (DUF524 family)